ncbi:MAG: polysaccharide deacetylase family protein [Bacteroidales bacterium]|nr:polysaccharide deacetylase family protein [Bacteroidales bacterium]
MKNGSFIISLDFEMMWGALDLWTPEDYGKSNVENVRTVVKRLVETFNKYGVHSTFASVGLLMLDGKEEAKLFTPRPIPSYLNSKLSPFDERCIDNIKKESLYFAPDVISFLNSQEGVEVASHTFGHYYCWEEGQTIKQFEADIQKSVEVSKIKGLRLNSIIFPRNQVTDNYLDVCSNYGFEVYRGISPSFSKQPKSKLESVLQRIGRLADTYVNIGGNSSIPYNSIDTTRSIINIPSSRFLRPYSRELSFLDGLKLRRIKGEMIYAANHGELYHLWWHPHNFGSNIEENFKFLEKILKCYQECHIKYGMESYTMNEFAKQIKQDEYPSRS